MRWMAKKKYFYIATMKDVEAEEEFYRLNPGASILACSPPGYHAAMQAKAAKAAAAKRKPARR